MSNIFPGLNVYMKDTSYVQIIMYKVYSQNQYKPETWDSREL